MPALKSAKHELFACGIVEGKSGREAYKAAGYKASDAAADTNASRLLKNAQVSARIAELKADAAKATVISAARVLEELGKIGFANMLDYMRVDAGGDPVLEFGNLTRDQAAALAEVSVETFMDGAGDDAREVRKVKFKLCDKRAALVDIGKHLGMFKERVEHSGANGGPIETHELTDIEAARRIAFLLTQATKGRPNG